MNPHAVLRWLAVLVPLAFAAKLSATTHAEPAWFSVNFGAANAFRHEPVAITNFEYRFARSWHGLHPWLGVGVSENRSVLAGAGLLYDFPTPGPLRFTIGTGPTYYSRQGGRDLGFRLQFYSFAEASTPIGRRRDRIVLRVAHVSNARLGAINPGTEVVTLGYAFRLP